MKFWQRRPPNAPDVMDTGSARRGGWRRRALLLCALVVAVAAAAGMAAWLRTGAGGDGRMRTAAIIDQLSLTAPNAAFVEAATGLLQDAGYSVTYYPGEQVTVDLYRGLPARNYDLIILRAHSAPVTVHNDVTGEVTNSDFLSIFTGEPYANDKYQEEQDLGRIARSQYLRTGSPREYVFGIVPSFVQRSMTGRFNHTAIVMMGCEGLRDRTTAQAFLDRGASEFVSWSQPVSSVHTDRATERLLELYLKEHRGWADAVKETAAEVGPDPYFGGELRLLSEQRSAERSR